MLHLIEALNQGGKIMSKYNGWTNYETWVVNLWIDNDEGSQANAKEMADRSYKEAPEDGQGNIESFYKLDYAILSQADALKELIEDMNPLASEASLFTDLLGAALAEVNWREIAKHHMQDAAEDEEEAKKDDK